MPQHKAPTRGAEATGAGTTGGGEGAREVWIAYEEKAHRVS